MMQFYSQPSTPWLRMLFKRCRLKEGEIIPDLQAEWLQIETTCLQAKLSTYHEVCGFDD